ncbi:MAG: HD domain-containing protein [Candidatus Paceibacterota bacterium]
MENKFKKIKEIVEKEASFEHKIDHVLRVYNLCLLLAKNEKVDLDILKAAALLHDIARTKEDKDTTGKIDHALLGAEMAEPILKKLKFPEEKIQIIKDCIISHRYRNDHEPKTIEAKILFDADKLDTIGATGIARSFVWIGKNDAKIYSDENVEKYIKNNLEGGKINGRIINKTKHSPQVEFQTKTKFLKKKLYTKKGREVCKERLEYVEKFLKRLEKEIKGKI